MRIRAGNGGRSIPRLGAIACMAAICAIIAHKGYVGISELARQLSGEEFWRALAKYLLRNVGGGGPPADGSPPG
jgi:hypothetical protein